MRCAQTFCKDLPVKSPRLIALALLAFAALTSLAAHAERRALVIGNDAYKHVGKLANAVTDARSMERELKEAGFKDAFLHTNLDYRRMVQALDAFVRRVEPGDEIVIFYAGHGVQLKTGNYLLPVDIEGNSESEVEATALSLDVLMERTRQAQARFTLVVLDACRDNPFKGGGGRSIGEARGLRPPEPPRGHMVIYSAARGQQALDRLGPGDTDPNGVFTREFIKRMRTPGLPVEALVRDVQDAVEQAAARIGREQRPAIYNEARGQFVFRAGQSPVPAVPVPGGVGFDLGDIESERKARSDWSVWQKRMELDFEKVSSGFKDDLELQVKAWGRFLSAYGSDNPYSSDDERLRELARQRKAEVEGRVAAQQRRSEPMPPVASSVRKVGEVFKECDVCPELVVVGPGSFLMGSPDSEKERRSFEGPVHRVDIGYSLGVGRFEVTQGEWKALMGSNPSDFKDCGDRCPVEKVSWEDVQGYLGKLSEKTGKKYRLLSESEWEYVARAGTTGPFSTGEQITTTKANFRGIAKGEFRRKVLEVGRFSPNIFGLYDVHGNVREWVQDIWHDTYAGAPSDGSAWESDGDGTRRVLRSGSWRDYSSSLRSASRSSAYDYRNDDIGFRVARALDY